ncbi:dihydrofolate reductase family protein [Naasia aerilata]|uniref:Deaminase reductase n=1 Tax=Naasia aerilata TaxID=1162966 RepID=A0ABM8GG18_9MICO|nr:dihydrofolate reductase family protein [Naasia aerilata]BDZ47302.1 deaminase reductase [Naasia aerilata]
MSRIYVANHITLDGVIQGLGRPDEDVRDCFTAGGWATPRVDAALSAALGQRVQQAGGMRLLLGRRSYEGMLGYWNTQDSPFKDGLNNAEKFVASRSARSVPWPNTTLLSGEVGAAVADLKRRPGPDLCVMGSADLLQTLLDEQLVDELLLFVHPLVLGSGRRMYAKSPTPHPAEQHVDADGRHDRALSGDRGSMRRGAPAAAPMARLPSCRGPEPASPQVGGTLAG